MGIFPTICSFKNKGLGWSVRQQSKQIHLVLKACSIVAGMGPHELLHFVVEVVYLIQRIAFALHSVGFVTCVDLAFEGVRVDNGVVALFAVAERPFGAHPFFWVRQLQHLKKSSFVCKWGVK